LLTQRTRIDARRAKFRRMPDQPRLQLIQIRFQVELQAECVIADIEGLFRAGCR